MDYQSILRSNITFNKKKRIGRVIYIVEGNRTEVDLLKKIYHELLGYNYVSSNRDGYEMKFLKDDDKYSVVYVLNSKNSNISSLLDSVELFDEVNNFIVNNYDKDFSLENAAIFYLFDRDFKSNENHVVKELIEMYGNSREGFGYNMQGLLLLSYPAIEAFLSENLLTKYFRHDFDLGCTLKHHLRSRHLDIKSITVKTLTKAMYRMHTMLNEMGISDYNIDDFAKTNEDIFNFQEDYLLANTGYKLLSLLSMSLIDLGLVNFEEISEEENG
ncbi:MAG: hypothetical protein ACK5LT_12560 [Lachnospirales bacterium]